MTYEEAIELIKINVCYKQNVCDDGICKSTEDKPCAIDVAIEALKKQTPKNPHKAMNSNDEFEKYKCPRCGGFLLKNYPCKCGQMIKWKTLD